MVSVILSWVLIVVIPLCIGVAISFSKKISYQLMVSALVAWFLFLIINVYTELKSPDYELIQGLWVIVQLTIGTLVAFLGFLGCVISKKIIFKGDK